MKIEFWGTRGSIAVPSGKRPDSVIRKTDKYGGNTMCMRVISSKGSQHIIDAGTGIKNLGDHLAREHSEKGLRLDIYFTHTHWDHIQGFPFFKPAYNDKFNITLHAQLKDKYDIGESTRKNITTARGIKQIVARQHEVSNFPAPSTALKGIKKYSDFKPKDIIRDHDILIDTLMVNHPGGCIAYKFSELVQTESKSELKSEKRSENRFKSIVVSTDFEAINIKTDKRLIAFITDIDIWVADGQYEKNSNINSHLVGCGHSDPFQIVDYAILARVKKLIITSHSPKMDDRYHNDLENRLKSYAKKNVGSKNVLKISLAKEGDVYEI